MRICATFQKDTSRYHAVNIGKESPEEQPCQHCQHNKRMQNRASGYSQGTNRRDQDDKDLTGLIPWLCPNTSFPLAFVESIAC